MGALKINMLFEMGSVLLNMNCSHMSGQSARLFKMLVTLTTSILLNSFMKSLDMPGQTTLCCSLVVTLITSIFDTFMYRLNIQLARIRMALSFSSISQPRIHQF